MKEEKEEKKVEDDSKPKTEDKDENNESVDAASIKDDSSTFSDLEELLFCRSPNQVKVRSIVKTSTQLQFNLT